MRHAATHDSLTGLLNRSMFQTCLAAETTIARRTGIGCAVLYLDLDGFKPINDQHGHAVGDRALVWVAQCILRIARESDLAARLGGDEFAVLQKMVTDPAHALALGDAAAAHGGFDWGQLLPAARRSAGVAAQLRRPGDVQRQSGRSPYGALVSARTAASRLRRRGGG